MNTKALTAEMILAQRRGELIEKSLVTNRPRFSCSACVSESLPFPIDWLASS
jgi:hypothetical protein